MAGFSVSRSASVSVQEAHCISTRRGITREGGPRTEPHFGGRGGSHCANALGVKRACGVAKEVRRAEDGPGRRWRESSRSSGASSTSARPEAGGTGGRGGGGGGGDDDGVGGGVAGAATITCTTVREVPAGKEEGEEGAREGANCGSARRAIHNREMPVMRDDDLLGLDDGLNVRRKKKERVDERMQGEREGGASVLDRVLVLQLRARIFGICPPQHRHPMASILPFAMAHSEF